MSKSKKKKKAVKKDSRKERKKKKTVKKEKKKFLNEKIGSKKITKANKKFDAAISELNEFIDDLLIVIGAYAKTINSYLKREKHNLINLASASTQRIVTDLKELFDWAEFSKEIVEKDLDYIETLKKNIDSENKLLTRENKIATRQYRAQLASAAESLGLDEAKKEADIKAIVRIDAKIKAANKELLKILGKLKDKVLEPDLEEIDTLLDQKNDIKKRWKKKESSWKEFRELLLELEALLQLKKESVLNLKVRNRQMIIGCHKLQELLATKDELYQSKDNYLKYYDKLLVEEQLDLSHEQHMNDVVGAL